ncbi:protein of unknown function [Blastococcus saxobsidens DD2]|uniref:Uncharacterized protein n=1 Tax=Blastococcus saxobsidens (strain DD2) TaxID=1146883 RepID=H6RRR4_BLASD|nr:protein of unknown function [Blastococcus saxobsidens DD2]
MPTSRVCPSTVSATDFWARKKASVPPTSPTRTRAKRLSCKERRTTLPGVTEPGQESDLTAGGGPDAAATRATTAGIPEQYGTPVALHPGCRSRHDNEHSACGNAARGVKQTPTVARSRRAETESRRHAEMSTSHPLRLL